MGCIGLIVQLVIIISWNLNTWLAPVLTPPIPQLTGSWASMCDRPGRSTHALSFMQLCNGRRVGKNFYLGRNTLVTKMATCFYCLLWHLSLARRYRSIFHCLSLSHKINYHFGENVLLWLALQILQDEFTQELTSVQNGWIRYGTFLLLFEMGSIGLIFQLIILSFGT